MTPRSRGSKRRINADSPRNVSTCPGLCLQMDPPVGKGRRSMRCCRRSGSNLYGGSDLRWKSFFCRGNSLLSPVRQVLCQRLPQIAMRKGGTRSWAGKRHWRGFCSPCIFVIVRATIVRHVRRTIRAAVFVRGSSYLVLSYNVT